MKIKDLLREIERQRENYGEDFLEWDVYTEQCSSEDKKDKLNSSRETVKDSDGWEYFKCFGFSTIFPRQRIFTINVNY